jgi:hypothetical protein
MTSDPPRTRMIRVLAQLYYRNPDIERVVSTAGLDPSLIAWDERPVNTWRSVLTVAEDQGRVEGLCDAVRQEKAGNDSLHDAIEAYLQSEKTSSSPTLHPPTLPEASASERHLRTRLGELQRRYDTLTRRIAALDTDIGRALQSLDKQVLEERKSDLVLERDQVAEEMESIAKQLPDRDAR